MYFFLFFIVFSVYVILTIDLLKEVVHRLAASLAAKRNIEVNAENSHVTVAK